MRTLSDLSMICKDFFKTPDGGRDRAGLATPQLVGARQISCVQRTGIELANLAGGRLPPCRSTTFRCRTGFAGPGKPADTLSYKPPSMVTTAQLPGVANSRDRSEGELDVLAFDMAMRDHAQHAATGCSCEKLRVLAALCTRGNCAARGI